jgi:flagellar hook-length control protein FliK
MNSASATPAFLPAVDANLINEGQQKQSKSALSNSDNSLKKENFSDTMKSQVQRDERSVSAPSKGQKVAVKGSLNSENRAGVAAANVTETAGEAALVEGVGGKTLPLDGGQLPPFSLDGLPFATLGRSENVNGSVLDIDSAELTIESESTALVAGILTPESDLTGASMMAPFVTEASVSLTQKASQNSGATLPAVKGQLLSSAAVSTAISTSVQSSVNLESSTVVADKNLPPVDLSSAGVTVPASIDSKLGQNSSLKGDDLLALGKKSALPLAVKELASQLQVTSLSSPDALQTTATYSADLTQGAINPTAVTATLRPEVAALSQGLPSALTTPLEVGKPGWGDAVVKQVMWMSSQQLNQASIQLDPPELGPLQVLISTQQDQTSVVFTSHHSGVREALDQGAARLREMMEEQGLNLVDVNVSDQSSYQQQAQAEQEEAGSGPTISGQSLEMEQDQQPVQMTVASIGLVDDYV